MIRCWIRLQPSNQSRSLGRQRVEGSLGDVLKPELPWEAQSLVKVSVSVGGHVSQSAGFPLEGCHCKFGSMLKRKYFIINKPQETTADPTAFCCCLSSFVCGKLHRDAVGNHHRCVGRLIGRVRWRPCFCLCVCQRGPLIIATADYCLKTSFTF